MMERAYLVRRWSIHFETPESLRRGGPMTWVAMPNKHDGAGFARATKVKNPVAAFCGWYFILQIASKMPVRGLLADLDGPIDAESLALKTRIPKTAFLTALSVFADDKIGWLETVPWDAKLDFWANVAHLQATTDVCAHLHTPDNARALRRTSAHRKKERDAPRDVRTNGNNGHTDAQPPADVRTNAHMPREMQLHNSTRQDSTLPLPSPKGDSPPGNLITNSGIAKRLICEKILGGRSPSRMWSPEAENALARKCHEEGGIPLQEIVDIAEWRSIPKSDDIPELKKRVDPITETGLMLYWGDEARRAAEYLRKYRRNGTSAEKKESPEPRRWQEFFHWKYGDDCELPATFSLLDEDQKKEWGREHEEWEATEVGRTAEVTQ